jgi:hypothetical protein
MEGSAMRQEQIDAIGQEVFAVLVSLLRPVARRQGPASSFETVGRVPLPPQRIEMRVRQSGSAVCADVDLWVRSPEAEPIVLTWVLPMPRGAAVEALDLRAAVGDGESGGLCERREARTWFDLARRAGLPGALLSEDAPGVFSLEVSSPNGGGLCVGLRSAYRRAEALGETEMTLRCEAGPGPRASPRERSRIVRLGSGQRLDSVIGIDRRRLAAVSASDAAEPEGAAARPAATRSAPADRRRADVFAACDRADGASAMFRGALAGRPVRLWADVRTGARFALRGAAEATTQLDELMAEYRGADRSEAERRELAARVARFGLQAGVATLWTSFVAVVGGHGPGGEMVFAAA